MNLTRRANCSPFVFKGKRMTLLIQQAKFELHQKQALNLPHFAIEPQQYWVVVGSNGSGKSAFALALQN